MVAKVKLSSRWSAASCTAGSSDTSVFTLKAELLEEGFFIRSVRDEDTGAVTTVVEFE